MGQAGNAALARRVEASAHLAEESTGREQAPLSDSEDEPPPLVAPKLEDELPLAEVVSQKRSLNPPAHRAAARSRALMRPCHAAHLASRMTPQPAILLEPSTGAAALPAAAWNLGLQHTC